MPLGRIPEPRDEGGQRGFAGAALFPVDHDEIVLEPLIGRPKKRILGAAGPAVQEQDDRRLRVPSADDQALPGTAQIDVLD